MGAMTEEEAHAQAEQAEATDESSHDVEKCSSVPTTPPYVPQDDSPEPMSTILWRYWWKRPLRVDSLMEVQLLLLTLSTGIQDAISFPDFRCFASNQTGNTVLLAVGVAGGGGELVRPMNIGVSLATFIGGAILTGQVGNYLGRRRRLWQFGNQMCQTFMIMSAAWIQFVHGVSFHGPWALAALALCATASGAQVAAARAMQIPEITTAMATAAWVDLVIDPRLLGWPNHSRDRRALFLSILVAGSFVGAFMRVKIGSPTALLVSGSVKLLVALALLVAKAERPHRDEAQAERKGATVAMPG